MIITIDGPAGTGKSTVAREVARRLGVDFLDTGAMYRAIALMAVRRQADLTDARELAWVATLCRIEFDFSTSPPDLLLSGERVTHLLRSGEVTNAASFVAAVPKIRETLVEQQRRIGQEHPKLVTEGRDQGSVVFPEADLKFYLDASPQERAHRRVHQLRERGEHPDPVQILNDIMARDQRDRERKMGPLIRPPDAIAIDTTSLTQEQVIQSILDHEAARQHRK